MRYTLLLLVSAALPFLLGCEDSTPLIPEQDSLVVQAYLYAGKPVEDIRLTSTVALDVDTAIAPPINDAEVILMKDGTRYECVSSPGDSGSYHYPEDDLVVGAGDKFWLEIMWRDQVITAVTTVPGAPENISATPTEITVPDLTDPRSFFDWKESSEFSEITVSWDEAGVGWYYVTLENLESDPVEIESFSRDRLRNFVFPPINDTTYEVRMMNLTHMGTYEITVYTVNTEYVDLYESREQDSRNLNEPLTNIDGGMGIFTAFSSAACSVEVKS